MGFVEQFRSRLWIAIKFAFFTFVTGGLYVAYFAVTRAEEGVSSLKEIANLLREQNKSLNT